MASFIVNLTASADHSNALLVKGVINSCSIASFPDQDCREIHVLCNGDENAYARFRDEFYSQGLKFGYTPTNIRLVSDMKKAKRKTPSITRALVFFLALILLA